MTICTISLKKFWGLAHADTSLQTIELDRNWIAQMLSLQDQVGGDQTIKRDAAMLEQHFADWQSAIGILHRGELVAQALIRNEAVRGSALKIAFQNAASERVFTRSTIGYVMVAPHMRGQNLMGALIEPWMAALEENRIDFAQCRVKTDNINSWKNFLRAGMMITDIGPSPDDETRTVYTLHRAVGTKFAIDNRKQTTLAPHKAHLLPAYLERSYVVNGWDADRQEMQLVKCDGIAKAYRNKKSAPMALAVPA